MKGQSRLPRRSECPVNTFLEILGDKWSLLVIRDLLFKGRTSYKEFLAGGEGVATNILADRLKLLENAGIIECRSDSKDARKIIYRLTEKGLDLAPVLIEMILWSAKHYATAAPAAVVDRMTRHRAAFIAELRRTHGDHRGL